ncbi:GntR family transcriptional regulator [Comamonas serinivorans]|nr:GntR family transcriptional regulator [Comamonas serinivorans]
MTRRPETAPPCSAAGLVTQLEEDIVFGRLHPRERLVEDELMARFEAKRHVVREALASLDRMGLVERRRNVGAFVRSFSTQEVEELYDLRSLLEVEAARQIALPLAPQALDELVAIQHRHDEAVAQGHAREVFVVNLAFHKTLFTLAGNRTLARAIEEYARQTYAIRFAGLVSAEYRSKARDEHWQMIEALRRNDSPTLQALCRAHLRPSQDAYLQTQRLRDATGG